MPQKSRSKGDQTIKLGQLTEQKREIVFLENYTQGGRVTSRKPFSKTSKLNMSLDQKFDIL